MLPPASHALHFTHPPESWLSICVSSKCLITTSLHPPSLSPCCSDALCFLGPVPGTGYWWDLKCFLEPCRGGEFWQEALLSHTFRKGSHPPRTRPPRSPRCPGPLPPASRSRTRENCPSAVQSSMGHLHSSGKSGEEEKVPFYVLFHGTYVLRFFVLRRRVIISPRRPWGWSFLRQDS